MTIYLMQIFAVGLMLTWPLVHAIALRYAFLALGLICLLFISIRQPTLWRSVKSINHLLWIYFALTIWIVFQAIFVSPETHWALSEFSGQWARSTLTFVFGLGLGCLILQKGQSGIKKMVCILAFVLIAQAIVNFADAAWVRISTGVWPYTDSIITGTKAGMSYLTNLLLAFIVAEIIFRINRQQKLLPINNFFLILIVLLALANTFLLDARNGVVGVVFLLISAVILVWLERRDKVNKKKLMAVLAVIILAMGAFVWESAKIDSRWSSLIETIPIAWDTVDHKTWLDNQKYPYPVLPSGQVVSDSNYMRIAWFKEGCVIVWEHPLGVGFGRNAFGHAIYAKYGDGYHLHTHSGVLDFTISEGIAGIILWFAFVIGAFIIAWRCYFKNLRPESLILLFIITGFIARSFVDSNLRDHMMEQFMFLLGLFLVLVKRHDAQNQ